ncbi:ABC transporter ATP-binding protein [Acuticoccus yangtzensis]|uniref:ABC transporter ATP-binding protein n=1 Tax=Acuticoccus yangtzensis TaxID=1443441 RepID=UPI000949AF00|nr:ABC transporter ATP-binding protein [Acuticoccus yangtzensis]
MNSDVAISVENLSKVYRIMGATKPPDTFRDALVGAGASFGKKLAALAKGDAYAAIGGDMEDFWALKDVSFEVKRGEAVGVIGRNGAGKSTLLKILSRITEPTEGRVRINGRVASLLEVGTGFHDELTGRENIFLNGAILGMSRAEIRAKFDEIVAFSGVEKFIDTPVKRYSSGMRVRLAFAVAAHLEPEILIVDEVLAVGDAEFQKKCLGKMQDVSGEGRTVFFVSHNLSAVKRLCSSGILLSNGAVRVPLGHLGNVIDVYQAEMKPASEGNDFPYLGDNEFGSIEIWCFEIVRSSNSDSSDADILQIKGLAKRKKSTPINVGVDVFTADGEHLLRSMCTDSQEFIDSNGVEGDFHIKLSMPLNLINNGSYKVRLISSAHQAGWLIPPGEGPALTLWVDRLFNVSPYWTRARPGLIAPQLSWLDS